MMMDKKIVNLGLLAVAMMVCGMALLEFSFRLRSALTARDDRSRYAKLALHDEEHHFCKGPKDRVVADRFREFIERPNSEYFEYRNGEAKLHSYNEYGYRVNERSWSQRTDLKALSKVVWVFGDSFVRGSLADNTETIPAYLTRMSKDGIYFINFGTGGYGYINSHRTLLWAQKNLPHKPTAILFFGHANDIQDDLRAEARLKSFARVSTFDEGDKASGKAASPQSAAIERPALQASQEVPWLRSRLDSMIWLKAMLLDRVTITKRSAEYKKSLTNHERFLKLAQSITPHVYVYYIPSLYPDQIHSYKKQDTLNLNLLQTASKKADLPLLYLSHGTLVDASKSFRPEVSGIADLYGHLDLHLNERGYFAVSLVVAKQLEQLQDIHFSLPAQPPDQTKYSQQMERCPD
ncbi:MAG: SGNH/GDSL hydrolase family protein [Cyanobacteria bacterium K_Offshore_surface_m2_239]|nr:SGNH/GDSL hydrolase family protein [Cyanobacteria bacterium K_Offshore_surface_m2_239]